MKVITQWFTAIALSMLCVSTLQAQEFEEGTHYTVISDKPMRRGKIEVVEVFSYSCGHCYNFEPLIKEYKKNLPEGVKFKQEHIKWDGPTENLARAFYTAKALRSDAANDAMFNAIHIERKRVVEEKEIKKVFLEAGVEEKAFDKTYRSFGVNSKVNRLQDMMSDYQIDSTPQLVVNGKYKIQPKNNVSQKQMLEIADYLIAKIKAGDL
ncbi:hypothetical protein NBRC116494_00660 [Aurantivibrio plasticivorans]